MLSDTGIKNQKPHPEKNIKVTDSKGLYLLVKSSGGKYFRFDYTFERKRKTLALGVYPETSLKLAREKHSQARSLLARGIDPSAKETANTRNFAIVCNEYLASVAHTVRKITHDKKTARFLRLVHPTLGAMAIDEIKSPHVFSVVKPLIDKKYLETAHRVCSEISSVFSYAIAHGHTEYDPTQAVARQLPPQKVKHRAAVTDPADIAQLLRAIHHYRGTFVVQCALRFSPLVFQRPGEIRQMQWRDVDLLANEWRFFVTKTEVQHIVPLSTQAVDLLNQLNLVTGGGKYVFPSSRGDSRSMSDNTIRTALHTLGYSSETMTPHGFRSMASTLLNEQGWSPDAIERQLCHMPRDQVRAAYNRAQYLDERRRMMQSWADYLDGLYENRTPVYPS
ncbi:MAG: tyrosine-type recombinase/integrase [Methyloglobulus sp.]|nr:tyrosine-type recombinase/integrase [Methyloglobulus sp.]